jgi:hypothetical protein
MHQSCSFDARMPCALPCVGISRVSSGLAPRVDAVGKPACEHCGRRLSKVKYTHRYGPGHACHPRCKQKRQAVPESTVTDDTVPPPKQSRKRRAVSDPGELLIRTRSSTRRVACDEAEHSLSSVALYLSLLPFPILLSSRRMHVDSCIDGVFSPSRSLSCPSSAHSVFSCAVEGTLSLSHRTLPTLMPASRARYRCTVCSTHTLSSLVLSKHTTIPLFTE